MFRAFAPVHRFALAVAALWLLVPAVGRADRCPNLTIVLDRSGSMSSAPDGTAASDPAKRKWGIAVKALNSLVTNYADKLPIGLSLFPSDNSCGNGRLLVAPGYGTDKTIATQLNQNPPNDGSTPTCTTIDQVRQAPQLTDASRKQYILLLTDGEPNCSCSVATTVTSIKNARSATPSISTFVVGYGALGAAGQKAMNDMAVAGGVPDTDPMYKYYRADSSASLQAALDKILTVISGELGGGLCDDSCYSNGCPAGQKCIYATCGKDPCAGVSCAAGSYCYTDGTTPGRCVASCPMTCRAGYACANGACVQTPCSVATCGPGSFCNASTKRCEPDPACTGVKCKSPLECVAGKCSENPCRLVSCPAGTGCVPWTGQCQGLTPATEADGGTDDGSRETGGCSVPAGPGHAAGNDGVAVALALLAAALCGVWLQRRRAQV